MSIVYRSICRGLMESCWAYDCHERPSFSSILQSLDTLAHSKFNSLPGKLLLLLYFLIRSISIIELPLPSCNSASPSVLFGPNRYFWT